MKNCCCIACKVKIFGVIHEAHGWRGAMKNLACIKNILFLFLLVSYLPACSNKPVHVEKKSELNPVASLIKGAPDWVNKGSNIQVKQDGRFFYGVAFASPMGDMAHQKSVADDGARVESYRQLSSYLNFVSACYRDTLKSGDAGVKAEAVAAQITRSVTDDMASARIIGSWRDPESNTIWSIAELDLTYVKNMMFDQKELDDGVKYFFDANSESIFDRIAGERQ